MSRDQFEGSSLEEALVAAAKELGEAADALEYEVIEEGGADFWGLGETSVKIRAWIPASGPTLAGTGVSEADTPVATEVAAGGLADAPDDSEAAPPVAGAADAMEASATEAPPFAELAPGSEPGFVDPEVELLEDRPSDADEDELSSSADLESEVVALLGRVFDAMGFDCSVETEQDKDIIQIRIGGEDNEYLLDSRGRGLAAIELLVNHAFRHRPEGRVKLRVDAGGFRDQRDEEIRDLAYQVSHQAKETEQPQQTRPLNPYERRIVHLTLADDAGVTTRSQGSGFMKTVNVIPTPGGRQ